MVASNLGLQASHLLAPLAFNFGQLVGLGFDFYTGGRYLGSRGLCGPLGLL